MSTTEHSRALPVYLMMEGVSALLFHVTVTIYVVYYARGVGLDPLQIMLVGTVFEATIFLFEVPTGVVADVFSRRLSIIIGFGLVGAGLALEGLFPTFGAILLAQIIGGIGATFTSGATEAWITDEIGVERAGRAFIRAGQVRTVCGMAGMAVSVALASTRLNLPFVAAGASFVGLALFLAVTMPETGFRRAPQAERNTWGALLGTFRAGLGQVRRRRILLLILAVGFVFAFHSEGFDLLWQKHILDSFALPALGTLNPVVWFGIIGLGANVLSIVLSEIVRRRVDLGNQAATARALMAAYGVMVAGIAVFALAGEFALSVMAYWLVVAVRSVGDPIQKAWLNQWIEPQVRATVFSMSGQINSLGEVTAGLPLGALGKATSVRATLAASGAALALTLPLLAVVVWRGAPKAQGESAGAANVA